MYVGYLFNKQMEFFKVAQIYDRDKLKLIDFNDFDPINMVISELSNVYLGYISETVVVFNHKDLYK